MRQAQEILGIHFDLIDHPTVWQTIRKWRAEGRADYITLTPAVSVMLCRRDERLRSATRQAGLTLPDSMGIILAAILSGYRHHGRVPGPDLMLKCCDWGRVEGYRHYFYGGAPGVADALCRRFCQRYPGLQVAGVCCPPFRELSPEEDAVMLAEINRARPDIVWVGLGTPKQEKWMAEHVGKIRATALIGVGAAFDFHSGNVRRAPVWVRKAGLEWLYRLAHDRQRLRRYGDLPRFVWAVARELPGRYRRRDTEIPGPGREQNPQDNILNADGSERSCPQGVGERGGRFSG